MNKEKSIKKTPDILSGLEETVLEPNQLAQKSEFKQENNLPDTGSIHLSVQEKLPIAKTDNKDEKKPILSLPTEKRWAALQGKTVKEFRADSKFIDKFILVILVYIVCLCFLQPIDGLKLSLYSAMSGLLSPNNYVETQADYADYLRSSGQYDKAITLYMAVIDRIKSLHMNSQLLALTELKLALAKSMLLSRTSNLNSEQADKLVKQALAHLGAPNNDTPKTLVETLRGLGAEYTRKNAPYLAYSLLEAASRFWKTGPTTQSEGNTYCDLGDIFEGRGDWQYLYNCYAHAYSVTKGCGDHDYNVYRLGKMGLAKNNLGQTKEATALFKQAIEMDERLYSGSLRWSNPYAETYLYNLLQMKRISAAEEFVKKHPDYKVTLQTFQKNK